MNKESLKEYLGSRYQGCSSFLNNVIFPIFGEDDFEDGFEAELLDSQPERRQLAVATGIRSIKQVGNMYVGVEPLQIFDVTVSDRVMMERNRVNIQRLIRSVMDQFSCAFMLFHYEDVTRWDWRFTYCRKSGNKEESTDSKRYTFLLGPGQSCRTATDNFMALYEKRDTLEIKDIENAFNVEALSKEFFGKYKAQYEAFVNYMVAPVNGMRQYFIDTDFDRTGMTAEKIREREEKPIRDYVKKLLGRIVFLHFLQKKGWLGVPADKDWGEGDRDFMLHLFQQATEKQKENFLDEILEGLFAEGLDRDRSDCGDLYDTKVDGFRNCRIPYLNGGLFERDNLDEKPSHFPASYFDGLLTMLSQYNFTIDENDPNDAEVGVDPEMLGRIFENLLEDNKDKGAFYTPKEIVQYMCRESLIAYLQTDQTEDDKERIRQFVTSHDAGVLGSLKNDIDKKLREVKICDPAIGSGAFPMGLLRELFFCRSAIEANIVDNAAKIKLEIIQNNIYGVDIEQGAVEIARLRFWLSIIVDEPSPATLPNLDYKIMKGNSLLTTFCERYINLDTKAQHHEKIAEMNKEKLNLYTLKQQHYTATGDQKLQLNVDIKKSILRLIAHQLGVESRSWFENNVQQLDAFDSRQMSFNKVRLQLPAEQQQVIDKCEHLYKTLCNNNLPLVERSQTDIHFFDWRMMFTEVFDTKQTQKNKEGFDIVIGNPPYVKEYVNRQSFDGFRDVSPYYMGKMDLWYGFACHGMDLLASKGMLCLIAQNNWTTSAGAKKMRDKIVKDAQILKLLDFNTYMVFENADIQTMIMLFENNRSKEVYSFDYRILQDGAEKEDMLALLNNQNRRTIYRTQTFNRNKYCKRLFTFSDNEDIFKKIEAYKTYLQDDEVAQGIVFPQDFLDKKGATKLDYRFPIGSGVFGLSDEELNNLNLSNKEKGFIKPYFSTEQIRRYYTIPSNTKWLIYTGSSFKKPDSMNEYPHLKAHLDQFVDIITSSNKPYGLHRCRKEKFFQGEKIISLRKCVGQPCFSYSDFDCYVTQTFFSIKTHRWKMKFLTGVLNSKLVSFWLRHKGKMQGSNYQVDKEPLQSIPLPIIESSLQQPIIALVDKILAAKKNNPQTDTTDIECEIDHLVYGIYGLSRDEIKIVEGN